jgi:hypothetical protein
MTVNELLAAFKASRRSLSTRPAARLVLRGARPATTFVTETKTPVTSRPEQAAVYASATDALEVDANREPQPAKRSRKPAPCKCSCNTGESARTLCENLSPCGHKGCGLS